MHALRGQSWQIHIRRCGPGGVPGGVIGGDVGGTGPGLSDEPLRVGGDVKAPQLTNRVDLLDTEVSEFDRMIRVNLRGTFFLTRAAAKRMIAESADRPGRSIVTITSANALMISPEKGGYCVAKAGLSMATQLFAVRLAEHAIPVFEIRPGLIITEMSAPVRQRYGELIEKGSLTPIRRWGMPEEVGKTVVSLATGALPYTIGQVINVDGGLLSFRL